MASFKGFNPMKLSDFDALSFDCYGTLIDWEAGILAALRPWLEKNNKNPSDNEILEAYGACEAEVEGEYPGAPYPVILAHVHGMLGGHFGIPSALAERDAFGASVRDWPAFPDSAEALKYLKENFRLFILSNIDKASYQQSEKKLGIKFDGVFTAEDIGSYKPDEKNFHFMLTALENDYGIAPDQVLHVAQSLFHDHVPAQGIGLKTCWIDRRAGKPGSGATPVPDGVADYDFRFESLADFAKAHMREMG